MKLSARAGKYEVLNKQLTRPDTGILKNPHVQEDPGTGNIAQVFLNVDLRNSIDGLLGIAKKRGINIMEFPRSNYIVYINEIGNRFKLVTPARHTPDGYVIDWIVAYYKCPQGRISTDVLYDIPRIFSGKSKLAIPAAGHELLEDKLRMKRMRRVEEVAAPRKVVRKP